MVKRVPTAVERSGPPAGYSGGLSPFGGFSAAATNSDLNSPHTLLSARNLIVDVPERTRPFPAGDFGPAESGDGTFHAMGHFLSATAILVFTGCVILVTGYEHVGGASADPLGLPSKCPNNR